MLHNFYVFSQACYMSRPSHSPWFDHPKYYVKSTNYETTTFLQRCFSLSGLRHTFIWTRHVYSMQTSFSYGSWRHVKRYMVIWRLGISVTVSLEIIESDSEGKWSGETRSTDISHFVKWERHFCSYCNEQWQIVHVGASGGSPPATWQGGPQTSAKQNVHQEEEGHSAQQPADEKLAGQWAVCTLQPTQRSVQVTLKK